MTAKQLLENAVSGVMFIKIVSVDVTLEHIQYLYTMNTCKYFIRLTNNSMITGFIAEDGKSYANSLPYSVISYLITNYHLIKEV